MTSKRLKSQTVPISLNCIGKITWYYVFFLNQFNSNVLSVPLQFSLQYLQSQIKLFPHCAPCIFCICLFPCFTEVMYALTWIRLSFCGPIKFQFLMSLCSVLYTFSLNQASAVLNTIIISNTFLRVWTNLRGIICMCNALLTEASLEFSCQELGICCLKRTLNQNGCQLQ